MAVRSLSILAAASPICWLSRRFSYCRGRCGTPITCPVDGKSGLDVRLKAGHNERTCRRRIVRHAPRFRGGSMLIAQISDPHIVAAGKLFRGPVQGTAPDAERISHKFDTAAYLARAVAAHNALVPRPDVAVVTGDLVDHGEPAEYEHLRDLLAPLQMPVFVIP